MQDWDRVVTQASVNGKVRGVSGDDFGVGKHFREADNGCVTKIHLRIFCRQGPEMGNVLRKERNDSKRARLHHTVELIDCLLGGT